MTSQEFEQILKRIRDHAAKVPQFLVCQEGGPMILEFCSPAAMRLVEEFVRLDTVELFPSYFRFEVLLEAGSWGHPIKAREVLLPYSSIVAIQATRNLEGEEAYYTYRLMVRREYGHLEELECQYLHKEPGHEVETVIESTPALLARISWQLERLAAALAPKRRSRSRKRKQS